MSSSPRGKERQTEAHSGIVYEKVVVNDFTTYYIIYVFNILYIIYVYYLCIDTLFSSVSILSFAEENCTNQMILSLTEDQRFWPEDLEYDEDKDFIGQGGFAEVYRAVAHRKRRHFEVALKVPNISGSRISKVLRSIPQLLFHAFCGLYIYSLTQGAAETKRGSRDFVDYTSTSQYR